MLRYAIAVIAAAACTPAYAQWDVEVDGPDVFGETTVTVAAEFSAKDFFFIRCATDGEFTVGWMYLNEGEVRNVVVDMIVQNDTGGPKARGEFEAALRNWNDKVAIFEVTDKSDARQILDIISGAMNKIQFGVFAKELDVKISDSISALGSTSAVKLVKKHCPVFTES